MSMTLVLVEVYRSTSSYGYERQLSGPDFAMSDECYWPQGDHGNAALRERPTQVNVKLRKVDRAMGIESTFLYINYP
jgi:hypothetical protein